MRTKAVIIQKKIFYSQPSASLRLSDCISITAGTDYGFVFSRRSKNTDLPSPKVFENLKQFLLIQSKAYGLNMKIVPYGYYKSGSATQRLTASASCSDLLLNFDDLQRNGNEVLEVEGTTVTIANNHPEDFGVTSYHLLNDFRRFVCRVCLKDLMNYLELGKSFYPGLNQIESFMKRF